MRVNNKKNQVSPAPEVDKQADGPAGRLLLTRSVFVTHPLPVQTESSSCLRPHLEAQEPFTGPKNAVGLLYQYRQHQLSVIQSTSPFTANHDSLSHYRYRQITRGPRTPCWSRRVEYWALSLRLL